MKPIHLTVLAYEEKQTIHAATLEVLETVGVRVYDDYLRRLMRDGGAMIDDDTGIVKLPPELVMETLDGAPKRFNLADRKGTRLPVPTEEAYIASRLLLPKVLDYGAEKPRDPVTNDIIRASQIANAMDDVDLVVGIDVPVVDITPVQYNSLISIHTTLTYTTKHLVCAPINSEVMEDWVALLEAATESGNLVKDPVMTVEVAITSPLMFDHESSRVMRLAAEKGLPVLAMPMPSGGGTAPITTAGQMVQFNAESLFIIVAAQMIRPGSPCFYGGIPATFDLRTGIVSLSSPEFPLLVSGSLEMGRFYGLPLFSEAKYTDSFTLDEQCSAEKIMSAFAAMVSGTDVIYGNGDLDNVRVLSLEQVIIDLDLVLAARQFVRGIIVDEGRLAVDAIRRVGPGGHYLEDPHTMRYLRSGERFAPQSYNRLGHRSTAKPQMEKAHDIVEKIVSQPAEPVISEAAMGRIHAAVQARKAEIIAGG